MSTDDGAEGSRDGASELPVVLSFFSGAGGLDLGFTQAGFTVGMAFELDSAAVKTYRANFSQVEAIEVDLDTATPSEVESKVLGLVAPGGRIAVIGGPPCQGFSRANVGAKADDPRNRLTLKLLQIAKHLGQKYIIEFLAFENVVGILDTRNESVYDQVADALDGLELKWQVDTYQAHDYGVPQKRRRVIFVGFRTGEQLAAFAPTPSQGGRRTVRESISGLEEPRYFSRGVDPATFPVHQNHWTMTPKSAKFSRDVSPESRSGRSFRRLIWDEPSPTVAYGHREIHVHPDGHRRLSIFEAMRLQGFPDSFTLQGNLSQQVQQISNAVPPPLSRAVAEAVRRALASAQSNGGLP